MWHRLAIPPKKKLIKIKITLTVSKPGGILNDGGKSLRLERTPE